VACGPDHPHGLRLKFEVNSAGAAAAEWTPTPEWEGFRGIIHGGIVSTVLDEAMAQAITATGCEALTAELKVRFRQCVAAGEPHRLCGWIVSRSKRLIKTEAVLTAANGSERAHAWASFLALP
jgi:acyl-coenzyme A thioesterase PaaI-like protein